MCKYIEGDISERTVYPEVRDFRLQNTKYLDCIYLCASFTPKEGTDNIYNTNSDSVKHTAFH